MTLNDFLAQVRRGARVDFDAALRVIAEHYHYHPTAFRNGPVSNAAGQNEGSCRIFAFARRHGLSQEQTLTLFGDHYWNGVLGNPEGSDHANIRAFMQHGWDGIAFEGEPLTPRDPSQGD